MVHIPSVQQTGGDKASITKYHLILVTGAVYIDCCRYHTFVVSGVSHIVLTCAMA